MLLYAFLDDLFQRVLTWNKKEQRANLLRLATGLNLPAHARILDFGCGTGLFAGLFLDLGFDYVGYDIRADVLSYASRLHPRARFAPSKDVLRKLGPYDLALVNCCAHHIADEKLVEEFSLVNEILKSDGKMLFADLIDPGDNCGTCKRLLKKIERGEHLRVEGHYRDLVGQVFSVTKASRGRFHLLSLARPWNPFFYDVVILECDRIKAAS